MQSVTSDWLTRTYQAIKGARDARFVQALNLLREQGVADSELSEVLELLTPCRPGAPEDSRGGKDDK